VKPLDLAAWAAALLLASALFSHTIALRLLFLLAGLGLVLVAVMQDRRSLELLPPLWLPILLWALWSIASLAWSLEPERTARELRSELGQNFVAFWVCFVAAQGRNAARIVCIVVGAAGLALCANAIYVAAPGAEGWFGGPGNLSSALLILLPCSLAAAWYGQRSGWPMTLRIAAIALAVASLAAAYTAESRTFWLALAAQVAVAAVLLTMNGNAVRSRRSALALFAAALALGAAAMTLHVQTTREALGARSMEEDPRLALWKEVTGRIRERPSTGYGFGRGILRTELRGELGEVQLWHAHNLFLDTALQLGIPGVLLLLALLGATLREGWRLARDPAPLAMAAGIAIVSVLAGMVVRNLTDVLLVRQNALLYWSALGVLLALDARARVGR